MQIRRIGPVREPSPVPDGATRSCCCRGTSGMSISHRAVITRPAGSRKHQGTRAGYDNLEATADGALIISMKEGASVVLDVASMTNLQC